MKLLFPFALLLAVVIATEAATPVNRLRANTQTTVVSKTATTTTAKLSIKAENGAVLSLTQLPSPTFLSEDATCKNPSSGNSVTVFTKPKSIQEGICSYSGAAKLLGAKISYKSEFSGEFAHQSFCKNCYGGFVIGNAKRFMVVEYAHNDILIYKGKVSQRHLTANRNKPLSTLAIKSHPSIWNIHIDEDGKAVLSIKLHDGTTVQTQPFMVPSSVGYIGFFSLQGVTQTVSDIKIKQGVAKVAPKFSIGDIPLPPESLSASDEYDPNHTRHGSYLNNQRWFPCRGWCAQSWCAHHPLNANHWIQADVGAVRQITDVKVQGRGDTDQWVNALRIGHSNDGKTWTWLPQVFQANRDRNTIVKIPVNFRARYVRLNPVGWHNHISLRFGLVGETDYIPLKPQSQSSSSTWENRQPICGAQNSLMNSVNYHGASSWCAAHPLNQNQWLQSDFGSLMKVTHILTQGRGDADQWVTSFKVTYSEDGKAWRDFPGQFAGNHDRYTIQTTPVHFKARYVRIHPINWHNHISMRVAFRGTHATQLH